MPQTLDQIIPLSVRLIVMTAVYLLFFIGAAGAAGDAFTGPRFAVSESGNRLTLNVHPLFGRELKFVFDRADIDPMALSCRREEDRIKWPADYCSGPDRERPHKLEMIELAMKEFDVFAGLREMFHDVEHRMDDYVKRLKLKGGVNIREDSQWAVKENVEFNGGFMFRVKEAVTRSPIVQELIPDRINWKIGSDLSGKYIIGELEIGRHLFFESSMGDSGECKMFVEIPF